MSAERTPHTVQDDFEIVRQGLVRDGHDRFAALRRIQDQLERTTSPDFSLVPKDEYARLKGIEEQYEEAKDFAEARLDLIHHLQEQVDTARAAASGLETALEQSLDREEGLKEQLEAAEKDLEILRAERLGFQQQLQTLRGMLQRDPHEPWETDISDYSDEWCEGFLAGQANAQECLNHATRSGQTAAPERP